MATSWTGSAPYSVPPIVGREPLEKRIAAWPLFQRGFAAIFGVSLALYALLGKGFAYTGVRPFYIGELLLLLSVAVIFASGRLWDLLASPVGVGLALFTTWQVACTLPYLDRYGLDAMRDGVLWGYSIFAWATAALVLRLPGFLHVAVLQRYKRFVRWFLILGPAAWLTSLYFADSLPQWPGTSVTIPALKGGEYLVHLAGALAFGFSGLAPSSPWVSVIAAEAVLGMGTRGGMLAFIAAAAFVVLLRPRIGRLAPLVASLVLVAVSMATFETRLTIPGTTREISLDQLSDNIASVIGVSQRQDLQGTKAWRLSWWRKIRDYTFYGPYFWTGKGYGINIADSDGFQVGTDAEPLRSPHNSHLSFLARSGVPGFLGWLVLQSLWMCSMFRSYWTARKLNLAAWMGFFLWLMAYWVAFTVSGSFDVFLEGPMAGIPFWTLFGLGWGGHLLFWNTLRQRRLLRPEFGLRTNEGTTAFPR